MTAVDELAATAGFPHRAEKVFPGRRDAVAQVREWIRDRLRGVPVNVGDVELCATELATNAVEYSCSRGDQFAVVLCHDTACVQVVVIDAGPLPEPPVDENRDGGRGLVIVRAFTQACGWETYEGCRIAWFRINLTGRPS